MNEMRNRHSGSAFREVRLLVVALALAVPAHAEFLEMPEIQQTPELRPRTLLRDMDIPAVRFRSPDPAEGPRLAVSEFRIQGLVEYPRLGITREALAKLAERIRFDLMEEGKLLESGYTIDELGEVSDLLGNIEEETVGRHVEPVDVQRLVWLVREQRGKRGITLGQIETVANSITQFYRERGFVLAKAYIPAQQVRDGIVSLTVLLGTLGSVEVSGHDLYGSRTVASAFDDMLGQPVTSAAVEERLFLINDYPGIFVEGHFEPGIQVGDTQLGITVKDETRYGANVRVDNHGTDDTGLYRLYGDVQLNNPLGLADRLQASALYAFEPSNNDYWQINYQAKLFGPRTRVGIEASTNQFIADQSEALGTDLVLRGDVFVSALTGTYIARRSRKSNAYFDIRYEVIESNLQLGDIPDYDLGLDDKLSNLSFVFRFDALQEKAKRFHQGEVRFTSGSFVYGADTGQEEDYQIYSVNYSLLDFLRLPLVNADTRLVYRLEGQYSGTNLSGVMRFSLSGPTRARAYAPGFFTADDAGFFGVDWIFNSPGFMDIKLAKSMNLRELVKPFLFFDYAYGKQRSLLEGESDSSAKLMDAGVGLKFGQGRSFSGNLLVAYPLKEEFDGVNTPPEVEDRRVVFDFTYSF